LECGGGEQAGKAGADHEDINGGRTGTHAGRGGTWADDRCGME
jgi:hypothetical protein